VDILPAIKSDGAILKMQEISIFDRDEFLDRCRAYQAMMATENIDLLILDQPETEFSDVSTFIAERKAIKSPREIEYLRKASDIADQTLRVILERIKPGHSARDCVAMSAESIISLGGDAGVVGLVTRSIDDTWILKPGMVFHMYTVAKGLAFSETFLVTDTEGERLTRSQRSILTARG
jgi:Xaa-Pro aminopeptidase